LWVNERGRLGEWTRSFFKEVAISGGANIREDKLIDKYLNEVYMSKALGKDIDASRKPNTNKFEIVVDNFVEEEAKTMKRANTLRAEWIRFYMRNNKVSKSVAEKAVVIRSK
jgi:hypothetical protein